MFRIALNCLGVIGHLYVSDSNEKTIISVSADRQFFGRLVVVAKSRDKYLKNILQHELSNVPLSLVKPDGTLNKGTKRKLMAEMEKEALIFETFPTKVNDVIYLMEWYKFKWFRKGVYSHLES